MLNNDTRVKICGITSVEDARLSASLGADYLGLIFVDSPRRVSLDVARDIRDAVPRSVLIGVFADAPADEVADTCVTCGLNMIQLHGAESPAYCDELQSRISLPVIKVFKSSQLGDLKRIREYVRTSFLHFDLDKKTDTGAAQKELWKKAAGLRRKGYRIFLAGKLNSENVGEALECVLPFCVDVASGVERSPGVKDPAALSQFIAEVKR